MEDRVRRGRCHEALHRAAQRIACAFAAGDRMAYAMANPDNAGAASTDYLHLFGLVTLAYMWARMAKVAQDKQASSGEHPYLKTKLVTGKFFMERMLPETSLRLSRIRVGAASMMELPAEAF